MVEIKKIERLHELLKMDFKWLLILSLLLTLFVCIETRIKKDSLKHTPKVEEVLNETQYQEKLYALKKWLKHLREGNESVSLGEESEFDKEYHKQRIDEILESMPKDSTLKKKLIATIAAVVGVAAAKIGWNIFSKKKSTTKVFLNEKTEVPGSAYTFEEPEPSTFFSVQEEFNDFPLWLLMAFVIVIIAIVFGYFLFKYFKSESVKNGK